MKVYSVWYIYDSYEPHQLLGICATRWVAENVMLRHFHKHPESGLNINKDYYIEEVEVISQ